MRCRSKFLERILCSFRAKSFLVQICLALMVFSTLTFAAGDDKKVDLSNIKKLIKSAKKLSRKGRVAEAKKILKGIVARNPENSRAKLELAYLALKKRDLVVAYNYSYGIAKAEPTNSYAFAILGTAYLGAGNFEAARKLFLNSVGLNKREALAWAGLGLLDFYENRTNRSIRNLREAVRRDSREPDFVFVLAQVSARAERYKEASAAYMRFLRISSKLDVERRDRIKGLIRFLRYLGNKSSLYELRGEKSTIVKMKLTNNRPVVQVRLKKKGELLNFVLDTGSGISVISNKTAKRLKIKSITRGGVARALGGNGKFDVVYGFLNKIYLGDVKIKNVPIYIREFHNKRESIDGYIGLSLISKYITTVDYGNGTFALERKGKDDLQKREGVGVTLPLRHTSSGFLSGKVKLEGVDSALNFILDTGASVSVISKDLAGSQEIKGYILGEKMRVIGAAGVTENVSSFLLPRVTFGTVSRNSLKAIALDLDLINETAGFEQAGILGGNFLKGYSLTFDFRRSKVTFVPNRK